MDTVSIGFSFVGFDPQLDSTGDLYKQLSRWLKLNEPNSIVLLIDEHDAPLTNCLNDKKLFNQVRSELSKFYAVLKSNDGALRFMFVTGITKFNKASIFSALNNLRDISFSPRYGTLLGYTHEEVEKYFSEYLTKSAAILGTSKNELFEQLVRQYDGYCFEETVTQKVFNPWSLLSFFYGPEVGLKDYWFESGGQPSTLAQYMESHSLRNPEEYGKDKSIALEVLSGSSDVETLSDVGLLTQAGYLTFKKVVGETAYVSYPNAEVRTAMASVYLRHLLHGKTIEQVGADHVSERLAKENPESVVHLFNLVFASIDYQRYPVKGEASVRAFVQVFLSSADLNPRVGVHNNKGRSDLEVKAGSRLYVLEFKVVRDGQSKEEKLSEALEQLSSREYGEQYDHPQLIRLALVFSLKERRFTAWAAL